MSYLQTVSGLLIGALITFIWSWPLWVALLTGVALIAVGSEIWDDLEYIN